MRVKVLRYAASRDDKIVSANEEVTFENEHAGWYVDSADESGQRGWDNIAIVERIGTVCFVACFHSRNALTPDVFSAVSNEAQNLQAAMQRRMALGQWIPLTYIAAFEALGWDARPLKSHREHISLDRMEKDKERRQKLAEAEEALRREEEVQLEEWTKECEQRFVRGEGIDPETFIRLCKREHIVIHPRTLYTFRNRIDWLSKTKIVFLSYNKGNRLPQGDGCFDVIRKLAVALEQKPAVMEVFTP